MCQAPPPFFTSVTSCLVISSTFLECTRVISGNSHKRSLIRAFTAVVTKEWLLCSSPSILAFSGPCLLPTKSWGKPLIAVADCVMQIHRAMKLTNHSWAVQIHSGPHSSLRAPGRTVAFILLSSLFQPLRWPLSSPPWLPNTHSGALEWRWADTESSPASDHQQRLGYLVNTTLTTAVWQTTSNPILQNRETVAQRG